MSTNFSYLLYFNRDQLWNALQGVVNIAEPFHPPTPIHFPTHILPIPLKTYNLPEEGYQFDDPELDFDPILKFEEDEAIIDWIYSGYRGGEDADHNPLKMDQDGKVAIGYIHLTVYNDLSQILTLNKPNDLILFDFGTTGTKMSRLLDYSTSIRKAFVELLERSKGVCGVFNRENGGDLFWLKGQHFDKRIEDAYTHPDEIEELLRIDT